MATIIRGDNNDQIIAGKEDDLIIAGGGNDTVQADDGNDVIDAGDGNDRIRAGDGDDQVNGGAGDDSINTDQGSDLVIAGLGNDSITFLGGGGEDILIGVDPENGAGRGEIDRFQENETSARFDLRSDGEIFVLGSTETAFYVGEGNDDFAQIRNFNIELDHIQLNGSAEQYEINRLRNVGFSGTGIFFEGDLIAGLEGVRPSDISLDSEIFFFPGDADFINELPVIEVPEKEDPGFIEDLEINNSIRDSQDIGQAGQENIVIRGSVNGFSRNTDRADVFKFEVTEPSQFNAELISSNEERVGLRLIKDFNNDGRNNFDDLLASTPIRSEDRIQFDRLEPGTYFVQVGIGTGAEADYELRFNAPPIETAQLKLNLLDIFPLSAGSIANPAPVRFEAEIDDQVFEQSFEDDFSPTLLTADVDINQREIPIKIRAFSLNPDGTETQFDIDPSRGDQEFDATYDTLTRDLFKVGTGIRANEGQSILQIVRGDGEGGRIRLNVNYETFTDSPSALGSANLQSNESGTNRSDTLVGTDVNGLISGKAGNDKIDTAGGDDIAFGGPDNDVIAGGLGDDSLNGGVGNDELIGGAGNDQLLGGGGNDSLTGVDPNSQQPGLGEFDQMSGGLGSDRFILGDVTQTYYLGQGDLDHAAIFDFSLQDNDIIQLHGEAADYSLQDFTEGSVSGVAIAQQSTGDLIGSVVDVSTAELSLNNPSIFDFVG